MVGAIVARLVHKELPGMTSLDPRIERRQRHIYLDTTRNSRGQAKAAPYSVRPYPRATVSTPLKWSEVRKGLDPMKYTIKTVPKRIDNYGDLWEGMLGPGMDLAEWLRRLEKNISQATGLVCGVCDHGQRTF
jgi:bifunctional non-homologous end joining protein LigD